jgi:anti-sigma B factor antagonist
VIERHDDVVVIRLQVKDLDEAHTKAVHADVNAAAAESPALPFILDLSGVKFLPSITLGAMVRLGQTFRARNQRLLLAGLQPTIRQVLTITKLDRLFEIQDDVDAALRATRP